MFDSLLQFSDAGVFLLRAALAAVFLWHGIPKLRKAREQASHMNWPVSAMVALGLAETLGAIGVLLGAFTQLSALILAVVMAGALYMKIFKWHVPFSAHDRTGWEFDLILFAVALMLVFGGGGALGL